MQIQIHSDHNLNGGEALASSVRATVEDALSRFADHITSVQVHLGDENAGKSGSNDKRCMMEARLDGRPPIAVTEHAGSLDQAMDGAASKLQRSLDSTIGRLDAR